MAVYEYSFTKLFSSILTSTIWASPLHIKVAWITALALADRHGKVAATIPGLAQIAGITVPQAEDAIASFLSPDKYSRSQNEEGRRIREVEGGWLVINYKKYREMRDMDVRRSRDRERKRQVRQSPQMSAMIPPVSAHTEAYTEADPETSTTTTLSGKPDDLDAVNVTKRRRAKTECPECPPIVFHLNERIGRNYQPVGATARLVHRRHTEFSPAACLDVIDWLWVAWRDDDRMRMYLRPSTIFNGKFAERYEAILAGEKPPKMAALNYGRA